MNYLRIYNAIIARARNGQNGSESPSASCAAESIFHLIIPGGIWGSTNEPDNIVYLNAHQQIVAYALLTRIYPYSKSIKDKYKQLIKARGKKKRRNRKPRIGVPHSAETRMKMSLSHRGKTFSAESRQKMSEAKRGRSLSQTHIDNRSAARRKNAKGFSEAAKQNMSIAAKNRKKQIKWESVKC